MTRESHFRNRRFKSRLRSPEEQQFTYRTQADLRRYADITTCESQLEDSQVVIADSDTDRSVSEMS